MGFCEILALAFAGVRGNLRSSCGLPLGGFSLGLDCSCGLRRAAIVGVPALIGFLGIVWLLPAWWARRPSSVVAPSGALYGATASGAPYGATTNLQNAAPTLLKGTCAQGCNFALAEHGAKPSGGVNPGELIDGNSTDYGSGTGFAHTTWGANPPQFFTVSLKAPVKIDCVRVLLWDQDEERYYRYKLEVCADDKGETWALLADHTGPAEQCRSWQFVRFKLQTVKLIRLTGTFNSSNSGFHVVELQAGLGLPAGTPPPRPVEALDF